MICSLLFCHSVYFSVASYDLSINVCIILIFSISRCLISSFSFCSISICHCNCWFCSLSSRVVDLAFIVLMSWQLGLIPCLFRLNFLRIRVHTLILNFKERYCLFILVMFKNFCNFCFVVKIIAIYLLVL
jgi:hypothetical protein